MVTLPDGRFLVRDDLGIQVRFASTSYCLRAFALFKTKELCKQATSDLSLEMTSVFQMFDDSGEFVKSIGDGVLGRCFGLATNGKGKVFTIILMIILSYIIHYYI